MQWLISVCTSLVLLHYASCFKDEVKIAFPLPSWDAVPDIVYAASTSETFRRLLKLKAPFSICFNFVLASLYLFIDSHSAWLAQH